MASAMSSPNSAGSPLSSLSSDDFPPDIKPEELEGALEADQSPRTSPARPAKRQRTGPSWDARRVETTPDPGPTSEYDLDVSSDTSGSVPGSPGHAAIGAPQHLQDEEALGQEQISVCKWDGCDAGDTGNMDKLVEHIHEEHIGARRQRYSCEWSDCARKGIPHASGYALRAHMRSHTREKPFYCSLPECDRSFTRSDALAKHMRTVHETEALRPSDPVPKHHSSNPSHRVQRLRLTFNKTGGGPTSQGQSGSDNGLGDDAGMAAAAADPNNVTFEPVQQPKGSATAASPSRRIIFPPDMQFTPAEAALPADELFRLLRRQHAWAEADGAGLKREVQRLEEERHREWMAKELVLENVIEAELETAELRAARKKGAGVSAFLGEDDRVRSRMRKDVELAKGLEPVGGEPWWRKERIRADDEMGSKKRVHRDDRDGKIEVDEVASVER